MEVNYTYDSNFNVNVVIVGQTGCRETTFIQNLAKKMFGNLKDIFWLSKKVFSRDREQNISSYFDVKVNFKYLQTLDEFNMELVVVQKKKKRKETDESIDNVMVEKIFLISLLS